MSTKNETQLAPSVPTINLWRRLASDWFVWIVAIILALLGLYFLSLPYDDSAIFEEIADRGGLIERRESTVKKFFNLYVLKKHPDFRRGAPDQVTILNPTSEELKAVRRNKTINCLSLKGSGIDDELLKTVAAIPKLISLTLLDANVSDRDLKRIVDSLNHPDELRELSLRGTSLTDHGLVVVSKCTNLEWLKIDGSNVEGKQISPLAPLKIERLFLKNSKVGDEGVSAIVNQWRGTLLRIQLTGNPVTDQGINQLLELPWPSELGIGRTKATPDGIRQLVSQKTISQVGLEDLPWSVDDLKTFNLDRKVVTHLRLGGWNISDEDLKSLPNMPNLELLDLSRTRVTDEGLKELARFPRLRKLYLDGTSITKQGLLETQKKSDLDEVSLGGSGVSYEDLMEFPGIYRAGGIVILDGMGLTSDQLQQLNKKMLYWIKADDRDFLPPLPE